MAKSKRQGGELENVAGILPGMEAFAPALQQVEQETKALTKQGKHHYTSYRQIDELASIGEDSNADMGFMARLLTLCSLPRTDPGARLQYKLKWSIQAHHDRRRRQPSPIRQLAAAVAGVGLHRGG